MLKELGNEKRTGVMRLHGDLSAFYSHANLNLPPELIYKEPDGRIVIGGGPRFDLDLFEPIVHQLLILIANALKDALLGFPKLAEHGEWSARFKETVSAMAAVIPDVD